MSPIILASYYKFFRDRSALSPETAISLTEEDFLEIGLPNGFKGYFGYTFAYTIKRTKDNKYWFSKNNYKNSQRNSFIIRLILDLFTITVYLFIFKIVFFT